jgi:hypothetical protein
VHPERVQPGESGRGARSEQRRAAALGALRVERLLQAADDRAGSARDRQVETARAGPGARQRLALVLVHRALQAHSCADRCEVSRQHDAAPLALVNRAAPALTGRDDDARLHELLHQRDERVVHRRGQAGDEGLVHRLARHQRALERERRGGSRDEEPRLRRATAQR